MDSPTATAAPKFSRLAALFGLFYFWQGIGEPTDGLLTQPIRELLRERGQTIDEISGFVFLLALPWAVKPLYGLISDGLPLAGYRRKSYLVVAGAVSAVSFFLLAAMPSDLAPNQLFWLLLPPAIAVAFSDVAIDALMIERAQPVGWTGQMQSIQWTSMYGAGVLAGWAGGYLSEHHLIEIGYLVVGCGSIVSLVLAIAVREDPALADRAAGREMLRHLATAWRTPVLPAAAAFLVLWAFNPFSNTVLQFHMRDELNFPPELFGEIVSWNNLAAMAGTAVYGLLRSRVKNVRVLLHGAIIFGVAATLAYWAVRAKCPPGQSAPWPASPAPWRCWSNWT